MSWRRTRPARISEVKLTRIQVIHAQGKQMNRIRSLAALLALALLAGGAASTFASATKRVQWPATCQGAVDTLVNALPASSIEAIRAMPRAELVALNDDLGEAVRRNFGMYRGNSELMKSCAVRDGSTEARPEGASMTIIEGLWSAVQSGS